jgi:hypothetical protein
MWGWARLLLAATLGAAAFLMLPWGGLKEATQELIAFLSLLMAGLLPAMTITATVLRGDSISSRRVQEYGGALRAQMRFWGFLFLYAALAALFVTSLKVVAGADPKSWVWLGWEFNLEQVQLLCRVLAGGFTAMTVSRLFPAYKGLRSLLDLSVTMATAQALASDRSRSDALDKQADAATQPAVYRTISSDDT